MRDGPDDSAGAGSSGEESRRLALWNALVGSLTSAVVITDAGGCVVVWNDAATHLFERSPVDVRGRSFLDLVVAPVETVNVAAVFAGAATGECWARRLECVRPDGSTVAVEVTIRSLADESGGLTGFVCESRDLSELYMIEHRAAEREIDAARQQETLRRLRSAEALRRAILAWSRDATMLFDAEGTILWASPATLSLFGVSPEELVGVGSFDLVHPDDRARVLDEISVIRDLGGHVRTEFRVIDPRGVLHWIEQDVTNLVDDPDVGFVVANVRDITDRHRYEEELIRFALHDSLTGLPNRSLLVNRLEHLLAQKRSAAVLVVDVDNFGDVNDSLGHSIGDQLLRLVGRRLSDAVDDSSSTLARVGGDEFAVLSEDTGDATAAFSLGELLRATLVTPFHVDDHEIFVTASVGVALGPGDADGLLRDAGIATRHAKLEGRDRTSMFDVRLDSTQRRRLTMQNELRHALKRSELEIWYQPMIDLQTSDVVGAEALVRWQHPSRGLLGPEQFIDVAEASGMIRNLGSQVLRRACADAQQWQSAGTPLRISINAAAAQLNSRGFVDEIERALDDFDLDPEQMTIEITETAAMQVSGSLDALYRIRNLGLHLALDDFGTGYSSLSFLRDLPIDAIKIDRAFIGGIGTSDRDTSIVQGVLAIAAALGHAVVAEGVETAEQAAWLRAAGCKYAQGYLWSRPVPATALQSVAVVQHALHA
jgi:diguanylate cyclase (GGDEF)-like protein/PAS domain S-box-containing protein